MKTENRGSGVVDGKLEFWAWLQLYLSPKRFNTEQALLFTSRWFTKRPRTSRPGSKGSTLKDQKANYSLCASSIQGVKNIQCPGYRILAICDCLHIPGLTAKRSTYERVREKGLRFCSWQEKILWRTWLKIDVINIKSDQPSKSNRM